MGLLVVPLKALEESKDHPVLVVVAGGQGQIFDFEEVSEVLKMRLFSLTQVLALE